MQWVWDTPSKQSWMSNGDACEVCVIIGIDFASIALLRKGGLLGKSQTLKNNNWKK